MTAEQHLKSGDLGATLAALQAEVRARPSDPKLRIFLFQLLSVLGDWKRAVAQLKLAAELDPGAELMAKTYREAIICEVYRGKVFAGEKAPLVLGEPEPWLAALIAAQEQAGQGHAAAAADLRAQAFDAAPASAGSADGQAFDWFADADMRLGPVLEVIVNGRYFWLPFARIHRLEIEPPADLRDAVWTAATLSLRNGGTVPALIPTRYPGTLASGSDAEKLARATRWEEPAPGLYQGLGQRVFATEAADLPLWDLRLLEFTLSEAEAALLAAEDPVSGPTEGLRDG